jgi:cysteine desulfurase
MNVYLDNAASTIVDPFVLDAIKDINEYYGNPSSIHFDGRKTKVIIEECRKSISELLHIKPSELLFTSSATEAISIGIIGLILKNPLIKDIIVSPLEHSAVLNTIEFAVKYFNIKAHYLNVIKNGDVDINHLEELLKDKPNALVCIAHSNNEIGCLIPLKDIANICIKHHAFFFSDTVQTIAKYDINLGGSNISMATGSAHKFHGLKGIGFLFKSENISIERIINGGAQERNLRSGTENIIGIISMQIALKKAFTELEHNKKHISNLKQYFVNSLNTRFRDIIDYNGNTDTKGLYNILSVSFKINASDNSLIELLDLNNISASAGSACSSGTNTKSHVIKLIRDDNYPTVRFSFSKYNTVEEIDYTIYILGEIIAKFIK